MEDNNTGPEKYVGFGMLLELPSGRVGLEMTVNKIDFMIEQLTIAKKSGLKTVKLLVLPLKPENVNEWRTHSFKVGSTKYRKDLIKEH